MQTNGKDLLQLYKEKIAGLVTFTNEEWDVFAQFLQIKWLKKNESFAQAGKTCKELAFVLEGGLRFYSMIDGVEVTGYFCFEDSFVTALKSYLTDVPCLYEIKALEDTCLVTISKRGMQTLLSHPLLSHKMERFGRLVAENFNIQFEDRMKSFVIKTAEERYLDLLESGKEFVNRIPVQYVAQFIGVTPVSLSRIRKRILKPASSAA